MAAFGGIGKAGIEQITIAVVANRPIADSAIVAWCAERNLPIARVVFVKELPKTATGKIHRDLLKRQLAETAGCESQVESRAARHIDVT